MRFVQFGCRAAGRRLICLVVPLVILAVPSVLSAQGSISASVDEISLRPGTVVVVPFVNVSGDPNIDWLGTGIAQTVTADLEQFQDLSVIDREGLARDLADTSDDMSAREVARERGVSWLVDGGFQSLGDQLRITARIVDVKTGGTHATVKIDGRLDEVFALQDRIVAELAPGLARITGAPEPAVATNEDADAVLTDSQTLVTEGEGPPTGAPNGFRPLGGPGQVPRDDAALEVGGIEETITVTGRSQLADVQNTVVQSSLSTDLLETLPTGLKAAASSLITLVPGVTSIADVGGTAGLRANTGVALFFHGKSDSEQLFDGMGIADPNGTSIIYMVNTAFSSETVLEAGGGNAESRATMVMNLIPREGGNQFTGMFDARYSNDSLQADNLDQELRDQGVLFSNEMLKLYNVDGTVGGPIAEDKVWFLAATRGARNKNTIPNVFFNNNIGPGFSEYVADEGRRAYRTEWIRSVGGRLTWQASERNKIGVFIDAQTFFNRGRGEFFSPEAFQHQYDMPGQLYQATYTSPVSNRLLFEAGFSHMRGQWPYPSPGDAEFASVPGAIHTRELDTNFQWNARSYYSDRIKKHRYSERASVSYVTGSHAFKVGMQLEHGISEFQRDVQGEVYYRLRNGVPNSLELNATYPNSPKKEHLTALGIFVQDQWTLLRLSINAGLRFDSFNGRVPEQSFAATSLIPARAFGEISDAVSFTDINPRVGISYDVAGNGRTALKFGIGRYVETTLSGLVSNINPFTTSVNSTRRTWNDTNLNFVPDCDLANITANGECGANDNQNFGQLRPGATTYDDAITRGFGNRNYVWDLSGELVQELAPGVSLTAGYYRNWSGNYRLNDNTLVSPSDYSTYCVTAPMDSRLPGGGGYEVCGLADINPDKFGQNLTVVKDGGQFIEGISGVTCGQQRTSSGRAPSGGRNCGTSDFVGISIDTRFQNGASLGGGFDTGRTEINTCFVVDSPQDLLNCDTDIPFKAHHNFKMFGSYPLPFDISISGSFRSVAGKPIDADWRAPNDLIAPSLGRNLSACGTRTVCTNTTSVPLLAPYTEFLDWRNMLDVRFSKAVNVGGVRLAGNLDVYNVLNSNQILGVNERFGPTWLTPAANQNGEVDAILAGRLMHVGGSLEF